MANTAKERRPFDDAWIEDHIEKALAAEVPYALNDKIYSVVKRVFRPTLINADNIPEQPCLFIGNHSLFAFDGIVLGPAMLAQEDRWLRGLGDRFLWNSGSEDFILKTGGVLGDPSVCSALMENGSDLLVFPGGAHEATKSADQRYSLQWKERYGFIKMAAMHGYTIQPMALVGPDEFYNHLIEGKDLPNSWLGKLLIQLGLLDKNIRPDLLPPIPVGALGSLIPKPQRCYVQFGTPVDLSSFEGSVPNKRQLKSLRTEIAEDIETMLSELLLLKAQNKNQESLWRRLLTL